MTNPLHPYNEVGRLQALNELLILNTPAEDRFDRIVEYAARHFEMPIVAINLVGEESTWCKAIVGLPHGTQAPRDAALCSHAILYDEIMVVENISKDERFDNYPFVTGPPYVNFYAGAPLKLPSGFVIGTLCLADTKPRHLNDKDLSLLACLRHIVVTELLHLDNPNKDKNNNTGPTNELLNFAELLSQYNLHAALTYLNSRTPHRFTAIYKYDGEVLRNLCLVDKYDPEVKLGVNALLVNTYCSRLSTQLSLNMLAHIPNDYPKVAGFVEAYGGVLISDENGNPFGSLCHFDSKRCEVNRNDMPLLKQAAPLIYKYLQDH